jgi:(p)ppGpp synthase/HD superfamily hydrolase
VATAEVNRIRPSFAGPLPLTAAALGFALERHAGQVRDGDHAPFVLHPLEVGSLLSLAGYADRVVAAGVLHEVLEDTDTHELELVDVFGLDVAELVSTVSEDTSIADPVERKAALRSQVRTGPADAAAVFAADKVSKARELRLRLSCGLLGEDMALKLDHYRASLSVLEDLLQPGHPLLDLLRSELEVLDGLPAVPR